MKTVNLITIVALLLIVGLVLVLAIYSEVRRKRREKNRLVFGVDFGKGESQSGKVYAVFSDQKQSIEIVEPKPEFLVEIMGGNLWAFTYEIQAGLYGGASDIYDSIKAGNGFFTEESANSYERVFIGSKLLAEVTLTITKIEPDEEGGKNDL
jgi:hypothetical protein